MSEKSERTENRQPDSDENNSASEKFQQELLANKETASSKDSASSKESTSGKDSPSSNSGGKAQETELKELTFDDPFKTTTPSKTTMEKGFENRQNGVRELAKWSLENFSKIDTNGDGKLSNTEIETQMLNKTFATNKEAAANLYALRLSSEFVHSGLNHGDKGPTTKQDLQKIENLSNSNALVKNFKQLLKQGAAAEIDELRPANKYKDSVTPSEVDETLKRNDLLPHQREGFQAIKEQMDQQLKAYPHHAKTIDGREIVGNGRVNYYKDDAAALQLSQMGKQVPPEVGAINMLGSKREFAQSKLDEAEKKPSMVSQGHAGDCFFLAPAISLQNIKPDAIKNMIKDNDDGTSTVTFPGGKDGIKVESPTAAEMAMFGGNKEIATLEKALAATQLNGMKLDKTINSSLPVEKINGGLIKDAMHLLTGKETDTVALNKNSYGRRISDEELKSTLEKAAQDGLPIAVGISQARQPGIISRHAYSVTYDEKTGKVTAENPIKPVGDAHIVKTFPTEPSLPNGRPRDGVNDGRFSMTLAEFRRNFDELTIGGK